MNWKTNLFEASTGKFLGVIECITGEIKTWESDTYLVNQEVAAPTYDTFIGFSNKEEP